MFVHDFVVVRRPFGELLAELPFILEYELASLVHELWGAAQINDDAERRETQDGPPTVIIGAPRERLDSIVYPVAWSDARSLSVPGLEADLELSVIDRISCDLHILGRCSAGEDVLPEAFARQARRETVHAVRSVLEHLKERLESPPLLRSFPRI